MGLDPVRETQTAKHGERARIDAVAAKLVSRKGLAIDDEDACSGTRENRRGDRPGWTSPRNEHVPHHIRFATS
jgi:hypothetical protein